MLTVEKISKSYGPNSVLNDIAFSLNRGQRAGLVGANGVGKTTLLKIIIGSETADSGRVSYAASITTGYLPQTSPSPERHTIDSLIQESVGELRRLASRMRKLEKAMTTAENGELTDIIKEYGEVSEKFENRGGYDIDYNIDMVLDGLGISYLEKFRALETLSGGEKTRVGLAALLLKSPDLLILDETTNNLDWQSLDWLEKYLSSYRGAIIAASHDRQFLNNTATDIFEIDEYTHRLKKYAGNYDAYMLSKEAEKLKWEEDYRRQQEEIRELKRVMKTTAHSVSHYRKPRDADKFIPHFKGERTQKADTHVISTARKRLERIQENPVAKPPKPLQFKGNFTLREIKSAAVIKATGINKSYVKKTVLRNISLLLSHDSRIIITGPNGSGKTTLLRILTGIEKADSGDVSFAPGIRTGYLPQEPEITATDITVLEYYGRGRPGNRSGFMSELLLAGIFHVEDLNKKIGELSLGQVRRLELAQMIAEEPNTLILDEPTNYISLDVLEALEKAIVDFQGPVIAVSHDRRFIEKLGGTTRELSDGKLLLR